MMVFYCYGKKGVCDNEEQCYRCDFWDGKGGKEANTNADRIRAMSDEELARRLCTGGKCPVTDKEYCNSQKVCGIDCVVRWLQQPAKEDE